MCHRSCRFQPICRLLPREPPRVRRGHLRRLHPRRLHLRRLHPRPQRRSHRSRCYPPCREHPVRRLTRYRRPEDTVATTWNLSKGLASVVTASAAAFGVCPSAAADPAATQPTPQPNSTQQLPGLPALSQLSPIIQQAASNPAQATQLLMAAAQAFTHSPTAPAESKNVAASVNQFVQEPASPVPGAPAPGPGAVTPPDNAPVPHVPPAGIEPGMQAHLPPGIDPTHAAGPAPVAAPTAAPPVATPPVSAPVPGAFEPVNAPVAAPAPVP